jgi:hypothetical protein
MQSITNLKKIKQILINICLIFLVFFLNTLHRSLCNLSLGSTIGIPKKLLIYIKILSPYQIKTTIGKFS